MLTTNDGNYYGDGLFDYIQNMNKKIERVASACQKRKFKLSKSKRYQALVHKLRATIDKSVNDAINRLVENELPSIIVAENLDFRNASLSKQINKVLGNCGRKAVTAKLTALQQELGIDFIEVNPAYTSQSCSKCGYVDKKNRNTRDKISV